MNISALCLPAHKGLYGPQGVGAIIFKSDNLEHSVIEGGTGINSLEPSMPDFLPEMHEAGTLSTPAIAGWCEALKWIISLDINKIRMHEEDLYNTAIDLLKENSSIILHKMNDYPGNTLLFNVINKSPAYISEELNKKGICTRSGLHCSPLAHKSINTAPIGATRISFSVFNSRNDVYQLVEALENIIKKK